MKHENDIERFTGPILMEDLPEVGKTCFIFMLWQRSMEKQHELTYQVLSQLLAEGKVSMEECLALRQVFARPSFSRFVLEAEREEAK